MTTKFISRLKKHDETAWFELWETFGPVLRGQLTKWGRGRIGPETVRDLSQETLAALSDSIERYDPARGARFSTWLLAIARHVLGDEIDRRAAQKRGGSGLSVDAGQPIKLGKASEFDESWMSETGGSGPSGMGGMGGRAVTADDKYEVAIFRAKVHAALRLAERDSDFADFEVYRMRVLDGRPGKDVADALGLSEPTVSRRLARVRVVVRAKLAEVIATYSFTDDEADEGVRAGLVSGSEVGLAHRGSPERSSASKPARDGGGRDGEAPASGPQADAEFDDAVGEIYRLAVMDRD